MALARRYAALPPDGAWAVGGSHIAAEPANGSGADLLRPGFAGRAACIHQKVAKDASRRFGNGAQAPKGVISMSKRHHGSTLDDFLKGDGVFEDTQTLAIKEVVVWQLTDAMQRQSLSKARLATLLKTSRSQVDRLLDPTRDVTLSSLQRAAALVGRKVQIELV
jgi:antitoxin HicB